MNALTLAHEHTVATLEAYEHWAPAYPAFAHNPLMRAEEAAMRAHWPEVTGRTALDLACGTGRYAKLLAESHAAQVVALDFSSAMLGQVLVGARVCASMMRLPFAAGAFAVVTCGLALGHATDLHPWMIEIARVLKPGGVLLYSDFHPEAAQAGLTRSFKDASGRTRTLPHRCYSVAAQELSVAAAGLTLEAIAEVRVGIELQERFAGCEEFYDRWHGLPLVLVMRARS